MNQSVQSYILAACTRASIRTMGMQSANMECMIERKSMKYSEKDFMNVIHEEGIEYNDIQSLIQG